MNLIFCRLSLKSITYPGGLKKFIKRKREHRITCSLTNSQLKVFRFLPLSYFIKCVDLYAFMWKETWQGDHENDLAQTMLSRHSYCPENNLALVSFQNHTWFPIYKCQHTIGCFSFPSLYIQTNLEETTTTKYCVGTVVTRQCKNILESVSHVPKAGLELTIQLKRTSDFCSSRHKS